jgi:putative ABC transport system permease protein
MKLLPLVLKNVFRKRTRSILTIGSVLLPLFVICVLGTLLMTLDADPTGGKGMFRLIVRHKVSLTNPLPEAYEEKIRQLPGVKEIAILNWFGGMYVDQSPKNMFARFGTEPAVLMRIFDEATIVQGSEAEWASDRAGALVGERLMKKYGWRLGDKVALTGDIYPGHYEFTIRAVFRGPDETGFYFDRKVVEESVEWARGTAGTFWIKAESAEAGARLTKQIDDMFENTPYPTKTETEKEFQNGFVSMLGNVKAVVTAVSVSIVLVILLIAANTMAMTARERVTEIAVLRTLGFPKSAILGMVLGESMVLSLVGGLLGIGLFALSFPGFREGMLNSPMGGFGAAMRIFPEILVLAFCVTLLVGLLSGLVPAIRSAQRPIPEGLRQVA